MPFIFVCIICKSWQNNLAFSVRQTILVKNYFFKSQNLLQLEPGWGEGRVTSKGKMDVIKAEQQHGLYICDNLVIGSWKQQPCSLLVWKHKSPFLLVKKCTCIKGKPPTGGQFLQEPTERRLGGFAICCPSCPFEHLHLLLASPCAAAGISHSIMVTYSDTILFSIPSCLSACDLAQLCFFQHPPL